MSLAQKVERPQGMALEAGAPTAPPTRAAIPVDFRDITRRAGAALGVAIVKPDAPAAVRKESELAFELLNEVARAFPALVERCERLDVTLAETKDLAKAEIEAANDVAREWQQIASALKLQVEGLEKGMKALKQRAEAAEQQVAVLRDTADRSQHAAAEAECLSSLFQEKVITAFGVGSALHPLLDSFRPRPSGLVA